MSKQNELNKRLDAAAKSPVGQVRSAAKSRNAQKARQASNEYVNSVHDDGRFTYQKDARGRILRTVPNVSGLQREGHVHLRQDGFAEVHLHPKDSCSGDL